MKKFLRNSKIILLKLTLVFSITLSGQTTKVKKFTVFPIAGYMWQGTNNVDFGLQPMLLLNAKNNHSNIELLITCNILLYKRVTYFSPMTKLRIMPDKRNKLLRLAWFASVGHTYTNIQNKYDHRITPELGVKWEWYNLSVGYNIPVSSYKDNCTNLIRAIFSYNLF